MNRSALTRRGAAVAVAALAAGCSLTAVPAFADAAASGTEVTYTLDFTNTTFAPGDAAGATIVGTGDVTDQNGAKVGTVDDVCTLISVGGSNGVDTGQCTDTLNLPDGELQISTLGEVGAGHGKLPAFGGIVQGGTGNYDGAVGDVTFTMVAPATYQADITLR